MDVLETDRCMQDVLVGGRGSGMATGGTEPGEMEAGLQMDDTGLLMEVEVLLIPVLLEVELDEEDNPELDTVGGVN